MLITLIAPTWSNNSSAGPHDVLKRVIRLKTYEYVNGTKTLVPNVRVEFNRVSGHPVNRSGQAPHYNYSIDYNTYRSIELNPPLILQGSSFTHIPLSRLGNDPRIGDIWRGLEEIRGGVYKAGYYTQPILINSDPINSRGGYFNDVEVILNRSASQPSQSLAHENKPNETATPTPSSSSITITAQFRVVAIDPATGITESVGGATVGAHPQLTPDIPIWQETRTDSYGNASLTLPKRDIWTNPNSDGTSGSTLRYSYQIIKYPYQTAHGQFDANVDRTIEVELAR